LINSLSETLITSRLIVKHHILPNVAKKIVRDRVKIQENKVEIFCSGMTGQGWITVESIEEATRLLSDYRTCQPSWR